jgi:SAM-dependent methyltransferase
MKLNRDFTLKIHFILDQLLPPIIRDSRLLMYPVFRLFFGKKADVFLNFKSNGSILSKEDFESVYFNTKNEHIQRETDLNDICIDKILDDVTGESTLEVGCGRGYLLKLLKSPKLTGVDISISDEIRASLEHVNFLSANIEDLPFPDQSFDTVICAHTLEHVQDIWKSISELRRVCKKRLIVVVPCQRPYSFTFDLHLHFFPYEYSLYSYFRPQPEIKESSTMKIGGDLYYREDR